MIKFSVFNTNSPHIGEGDANFWGAKGLMSIRIKENVWIDFKHKDWKLKNFSNWDNEL